MGTTSVRLPEDLLAALDQLASKEHVDRSTVIRRAIEAGLGEIRLSRAMEAYSRGGVTAWQAAASEEVSLWSFLDELEHRGMWLETDEETLRAQLATLAD